MCLPGVTGVCGVSGVCQPSLWKGDIGDVMNSWLSFELVDDVESLVFCAVYDLNEFRCILLRL